MDQSKVDSMLQTDIYEMDLGFTDGTSDAVKQVMREGAARFVLKMLEGNATMEWFDPDSDLVCVEIGKLMMMFNIDEVKGIQAGRPINGFGTDYQDM